MIGGRRNDRWEERRHPCLSKAACYRNWGNNWHDRQWFLQCVPFKPSKVFFILTFRILGSDWRRPTVPRVKMRGGFGAVNLRGSLAKPRKTAIATPRVSPPVPGQVPPTCSCFTQSPFWTPPLLPASAASEPTQASGGLHRALFLRESWVLIVFHPPRSQAMIPIAPGKKKSGPFVFDTSIMFWPRCNIYKILFRPILPHLGWEATLVLLWLPPFRVSYNNRTTNCCCWYAMSHGLHPQGTCLRGHAHCCKNISWRRPRARLLLYIRTHGVWKPRDYQVALVVYCRS